MNVKMFNNDVDFFIFTTNKKYATQLKDFCTTTKSKDYWQKVIDLLQTNNIESNFNVDYNENSCAIDILNEFKLADDELAYYIDSDGNIIENFLPFDNARLNALIKNNIAPPIIPKFYRKTICTNGSTQINCQFIIGCCISTTICKRCLNCRQLNFIFI